LFLKYIEIFGFKSFADRTRVEFSGGITALLGPNGCGKSNVVDSVKWVLGEQSSRTLRAEKMEDVIFNGTEERKPLNVAEVVLILGNDNGLFPLDAPEIEIKRRLYRSGESEYSINGQPARLREVRELFWDTGVGKTAYSVMEQGRIDQVLSSKPEERRSLFEEAAGITRFKVKGAEAERKLQKTDENMRQVETILAEVKRSYESLRVQSEKTLKYRALRDEIFQAELDIQLLRLRQFRGERDKRNEELEGRTKDRDAMRAEMEALNKSLEENMDLVNSLETQLVEYNKTIYGLAVKKNGLENEAKMLAAQRDENRQKIQQNESREKMIAARIEDLTSDAEEEEVLVRDLRKRVADIEGNVAGFEENVQLAAAGIDENNAAMERARQEILDSESEQFELEKALAGITDDIVSALDAGLREAGYSAAERRRLEAALDEALGKLRTVLEGRQALLRELSAAAGRGEGASPAPQEISRIADSLAEALSQAAARAEEALSIFEAYRKSAPAFIDEFLAPEGIITKKRTLDGKIREMKDLASNRRERITALQQHNEELNGKIGEYRATLEELRVSRARLDAQAGAAEEQARLIRRELAGQEDVLKTVRDELYMDRKRFEENDQRITDTEAEIDAIEREGVSITADLEKLEKEIARRNGDMAGKKEGIQKKASDLAKLQDALERIHLDLVQAETEIKNIQDNFRENHSRDLMEFEERIYTINEGAGELRERLTASKTALKDLGAVNLMAPEEFNETKERFEFLSGQLADLQKAKDDLERITAEIRAEARELFITTYNKIKKNFHNLFRRLFGGGRAELRLQDPNHVLESGIEIYAQPPGKKLENITLLSGGERSMTAVALLFATYMVKPSPFCLLDEIDAALDEANVLRFVQLLREFSRLSQFIVITHNKKTAAGASSLLGATMEESGVTKVISLKLENVDENPLPEEEAYEEEEVEFEEGRELPPGVDDPSQVDAAALRPIRGGND
jgi:chromosome segregation protein